MAEMPASLPIDAHVAGLVRTLRVHRAAVLVAEPGAGKTTRVPPALTPDGPVFLLQPRRVAARSIARRIAEEQGWRLGDEVGWQVRFEKQCSENTRLLVATEGILTARLQSDPLLSGFRTVVLDEFHERSIHADLALAFLREAVEARDDLRVVVMSATLESEAVAAYLGGAPVIEVPGAPHAVEVEYAPGSSPAEGIRRALAAGQGHVLCFLPGAADIRSTTVELTSGDLGSGLTVRPLFGALDAREQDAALQPVSGRKVVLATNIAETSLTVDGVTAVVDSGWHKVLRYDAARGIDRLVRERIPLDSAVQRTGRAGRTEPGRAVRLWDPRDRLRPHREPEILRVDLAGPVLDVLAWGADPRRFRWFEAPPPDRLEAALALLEVLGAVEDGRISAAGRRLARLPLHPRLGRVLLAGGGSARAAAVCAVLSEGRPASAADAPTTESDVLSATDRLDRAPASLRQAARQLEALGRRLMAEEHPVDDDRSLRRALLAGFPDRVARRRERGSSRLVLSSGTGAVLARESGVRDAELLLALDLRGGRAGEEALVRWASQIEREWLVPTHHERVHRLDETSGAVRAWDRSWYDGIVLDDRPVAPDPEVSATLLAAALKAGKPDPEMAAWRRRAEFAGVAVDLDALTELACTGCTRIAEVDPLGAVPHGVRARVDRGAPSHISLPSGRRAVLRYTDDGRVLAAAKLQELFGLAETPRIGPRETPVVFELLAPNGRPVQTTSDLRSFWDKGYPEVRKELRGRYPRHPWPEDPWSAEPTHRPQRRR